MKFFYPKRLIFILFINILILNTFSKPNKNKKQKKKEIKNKKENKEKKEKINTIDSVLKWAEKNNIYINNKLKLNEKSSGHNFYYFSADYKIPIKTLLLRVPYNMMLSQNYFETYYKNSKNIKFSKLWEKISLIKNEYIKFFSTKQLFYISIIIHNAIKKKKGDIYNKYKEYFNMYENMDLDIFPIFYDEEEKRYLSGSSFGSQISRAVVTLNEEYYILNKVLNISVPIQEEFLKNRVLALTNSLDFNNSNYNYSKEFNETVVIPFIDCFTKVVSDEKVNARFTFSNTTSKDNHTEYFLEVYSDDEIMVGSEINLKWRTFPNAESLLYYGFVEEGNKLKPRYYIDIINRKFKQDLGIDNKKEIKSARIGDYITYELNSEFYDVSVINAYKNITKEIEGINKTYSGREEGPYEMMMDNLNYYLDLYNFPLSDGNINRYINRKENINNLKEIMHMEKEMIQEKIDFLKKVIDNIKKNNTKNGNKEDL